MVLLMAVSGYYLWFVKTSSVLQIYSNGVHDFEDAKMNLIKLTLKS